MRSVGIIGLLGLAVALSACSKSSDSASGCTPNGHAEIRMEGLFMHTQDANGFARFDMATTSPTGKTRAAEGHVSVNGQTKDLSEDQLLQGFNVFAIEVDQAGTIVRTHEHDAQSGNEKVNDNPMGGEATSETSLTLGRTLDAIPVTDPTAAQDLAQLKNQLEQASPGHVSVCSGNIGGTLMSSDDLPNSRVFQERVTLEFEYR